jgi:hypothetical protein
MSFASLLWADIGAEDFIKILVAVLFVLLPLAGKIINMLNKPAEPAKRAAPPPIPVAAKPRVPPKAANPELNSEVEEFLRRAAERRTAEQRREITTGAQRPEQTPSRRPPPPKREEPPKPRRRKMAREPLQAEVLDEVKRGTDVAEHVAQHFKPRPVLERAPSAQAVDQADEAMQEHLHAVFDHQIGSLRRREGGQLQQTESEPAPQRYQSAVAATDLISLLRDPQSVRHAIVLNEILSRPEHRW